MFELLSTSEGNGHEASIYSSDGDVVDLVDALLDESDPVWLDSITVRYMDNTGHLVSRPVDLEHFDLIYVKFHFQTWIFDATYKNNKYAIRFSNAVPGKIGARMEIIPYGEPSTVPLLVQRLESYFTA